MTGLVSRFVAPLENKAHRITSLNYGPSSHDILVSYSAENVYLFNTQVGLVDCKGLILLVHGRKFSGCLVWVPLLLWAAYMPESVAPLFRRQGPGCTFYRLKVTLRR